MIDYDISWLNCAKGHGLNVGYLGGWNERGWNKGWYENLRSSLNSHGFGSVKKDDGEPRPGRAVPRGNSGDHRGGGRIQHLGWIVRLPRRSMALTVAGHSQSYCSERVSRSASSSA
jgi:Glycosyl hydrolase family 59